MSRKILNIENPDKGVMVKPVKKTVKFAGHSIELLPSATLYLKEYGVLVVSDLHLEKPFSVMSKSFCTLEEKTQDTLISLEKLAQRLAPEKIIILGDVFHDEHSFDRISLEKMDRLYKFFKEHKIIWVDGHHRNGFSPPGVDMRIEYAYLNLNFRHISADKEDFEISGNYSPSVIADQDGKKSCVKAFVCDKTKMMMPSFHCRADTMDINDPVIQTVFTSRIKIYPIQNNRVSLLKKERS